MKVLKQILMLRDDIPRQIFKISDPLLKDVLLILVVLIGGCFSLDLLFVFEVNRLIRRNNRLGNEVVIVLLPILLLLVVLFLKLG